MEYIFHNTFCAMQAANEIGSNAVAEVDRETCTVTVSEVKNQGQVAAAVEKFNGREVQVD